MPSMRLTLRNRVRERRTELQMSINDLADLSGVNRHLVGAIDRDEGHAPSGRVQLKLAEALATTVQDLFFSEPAEAEAIAS